MKLNDGQAVILGGYGGVSKSTLMVNLTDFVMTSGAKMNHERYAFACVTFHSPSHEGRPVIVVAGSNTGNGKTAEIWDYSIEDSRWEFRKL